MINRVARGLAVATLLASTSGVTLAADLATAKKPVACPAMATFNPWMVRVRGLGVIPGGSNKVYAGGAQIGGAKVDVSNSIVPELDITYFFTPNLAAELIRPT